MIHRVLVALVRALAATRIERPVCLYKDDAFDAPEYLWQRRAVDA